MTFNPVEKRWTCSTCHLSSVHDFRIEGSPPPTVIPDDASERDIATERFTNERGLSAAIRHYIPSPDSDARPNLSIDLDRALLMRHLYGEEHERDKAFGYEWMEDHGYVQYDSRQIGGRLISFWCEPEIDDDDYYDDKDDDDTDDNP